MIVPLLPEGARMRFRLPCTCLLFLFFVAGSGRAAVAVPDWPSILEPRGLPLWSASGGMSAESVLEAYKSGLRYFSPQLTPGQVDTIARLVVARSTRFGLDPRLVVAVLAGEGTLRRVS